MLSVLPEIPAAYKFTVVAAVFIISLPIILKINIDRIICGYIVLLPFTVYLTGNTFFNLVIVTGLFLLASKYKKDFGKGVKVDSVAIISFIFLFSFLPAILQTPSSLLLTQANYWLRLLSGPVFYLAVINSIDTKDKLFNFSFSIIIMIFFYTVASFVELIWFPYEHETMGWRLRGPFREYELFSELLAMLFPLAIYIFGKISRLGKLKKCILQVFFGLIFILLLILTGTRGGPIALSIGLIVFLFLNKGKRLSSIFSFILILIIILPLAFYSFSMLKKYTRLSKVEIDLFERFKETKFESFLPESRVSIWKDHLNHAIKHDYWLIGEGPGHPAQWLYTTLYTSNSFFHGSKIPRDLSNYTISFPHSLYITLLQTGGVGALLSFSLLLLVLFYRLKKTRKKLFSVDSRYASFINILIAMLIIFVVDELKIEFVRYQTYIIFIFGCIFGIIGSSTHIFLNEFTSEDSHS